ncbi:MAG: gliding motility-associated C-terminal domain-containing protein [Bacteroidales bacterium]|jgi:gliding motility-associated-like protein|nr:gliding motility-associated C-terminal domain-containing protein [Bacteroidales bacterium]MDY0369187.1 gliding motility-associated C-terminal domain-containing protein [Bacteroidales bacterium]
MAQPSASDNNQLSNKPAKQISFYTNKFNVVHGKLNNTLFIPGRLHLVSLLVYIISMSFDAYSQPGIVKHPADTAVCMGGKADFLIIAVHTISYQWQENDHIGWYNIDENFIYATGYATSKLTIHDANAGLNGYQYRCLVSDAENNIVISEPAVLYVSEPPAIIEQPINNTVCKNDIASFQISAINGETYQWQENIGQEWYDLHDDAFYSGTDQTLLQVFTTTGMNGFKYRCKVYNNNCPTISSSAILYVHPTPTLHELTGGGAYCEGEQGVAIGLSGSETGVVYHLECNGLSTGILKEGTGSEINFGLFTQQGRYTVQAIHSNTACAIQMLNTVEVVKNPLPLPQQLIGGGSYCIGSTAPIISLVSTEKNIEYQLFRNGSYNGSSIIGNGFQETFGYQPEPGIYTVYARNIFTGCSRMLDNYVEVVRYELPEVFASPDQTIPNGSSTTLSAVAWGGSGEFQYRWEPSALLTQPHQAQTATIDLYQSQIFRVLAIDRTTGCNSIADSVSVFVSESTLSATVLADMTSLCEGDQATLTALPSGGTGYYTYSWSSDPEGYYSDLQTITVAPQQTTTYHVLIEDGINHTYSSITLTVNSLPSVFDMTGGGTYCEGEQGKEIGLSGSQSGIIYHLMRNTIPVTSISGTDSPLHFGMYDHPGHYTVQAVQPATACIRVMDDTAIVQVAQRPLSFAGNDQSITSGESAILTGSAIGGSGIYSYVWSPADKLIDPNAPSTATTTLYSSQIFSLEVTDQHTACTSPPSSTTVFISGGTSLTLDLIADSYSICPGETVQLIALPTGGTGNYSFAWSSNPDGLASQIYNPTIPLFQTTTFIVTVNDGLNQITDSLSVVVRQNPMPYAVTGGGLFCADGPGVEIKLSGSQPNCLYTLWHNGSETNEVRIGNGAALSFGEYVIEGSYQINALSLETLCSLPMDGTAIVWKGITPTADAGPDQSIIAGNIANLFANPYEAYDYYSFLWEPANKVIHPYASQTNTIPLIQTQAFTLHVTDTSSHCHAMDEVVIYVREGDLTAVISAQTTTICEGSTTQLMAVASGGSGSYTYSWTSDPAGFYSTLPNPVISPDTTTIYKVIVYDGQQSTQAQIKINLALRPESFSVTGGGYICTPDDKAAIGLLGSQTSVHYSLHNNGEFIGSLTGTGEPLSFGLFSMPGVYTVQATTSDGQCASNMSGAALIHIGGTVIAHAGPDKYLSQPGQVTLEGEIYSSDHPYTFSWFPEEKLLNPEVLQPTTLVLNHTTLFKLQASSSNTYCQVSEDYTVVYIGDSSEPMQLSVFTPDETVCQGSSARLFALPTGGNGSYWYQWTSLPQGYSSSEANPTVFPETTTTYMVLVTDGVHTLEDSITIQVLPAPDVFTLSGGGIYCAGSPINDIILQGSEHQMVYTLHKNGYPTDYVLSGTGAPLQFGPLEEAGIYTVVAKNPISLCSRFMSGEITVSLSDVPIVVCVPLQHISSGSSTELTANAAGGSGDYRFQWQPASLLVEPEALSTMTHPLYHTTVFLFTATDLQSGCTSQADTTIVIVTDEMLSVTILSSAYQICEGEFVELIALPQGGNGSYSYTWTLQTGEQIGNQSHIIYTPEESTEIHLTVTDGSQTTEATIFIEVVTYPQVYQVYGGGSLCNLNEGAKIFLDSSENHVLYKLYRNYTYPIAQFEGNGSALDLGMYTISGIYTVEALNPEAGCQVNMSGSALIQYHEKPQIVAGNNQSIPYGSSTQLSSSVAGGSGNYAYEWQPSAKLLNPDVADPFTIHLIESTIFTVNVSDTDTDCTASDQTMVFVSGGTLEVALQSNKTIVCSGESAILTALPQGGTGNYSWEWHDASGRLSDNSPTIEVFPASSMYYYISLSDGIETITDSILIRLADPIQHFSVSGGGSWCIGDNAPELVLTGSQSGYKYQCFINGQASSLIMTGTGNPLKFDITAEGVYTILATDLAGCSAWMHGNAIFQQSLLPIVYTVFGGGTFCSNDRMSGVYLQGSQIGIIYELLLDFNTVIDSRTGDGQPIIFHPITKSGAYSIRARHADGRCQRLMYGTAVYNLYPAPMVYFEGQKQICLGQTATILATGAREYNWLTDPPYNTPSITVQPDKSTMFIVQSVNEYQCISQDTFYLMVHPLPVFEIHLESHIGRLTLEASDHAINYRFATGGHILQESPSPIFYYGNIALTHDSLAITAISEHGCASELRILVTDEGVRVNAFSPNNDLINDKFMPGSYIIVFDRWGLELYRGSEGWDGTYKGKLMTPGTYYYIHEIYDPQGYLIRSDKGSVTLVVE